VQIGPRADIFTSTNDRRPFREDKLMKRRDDPITNVPVTNAVPKERRKAGHDNGMACRSGYWTSSSLDLITGLDVVEIPAEGHWPDTMPIDIDAPRTSTRAGD
jgi:hypothetical protein